MKTKNIFRMLLMAVGLLVGVNSTNAQDNILFNDESGVDLQSGITIDFDLGKFEGAQVGDIVRVWGVPVFKPAEWGQTTEHKIEIQDRSWETVFSMTTGFDSSIEYYDFTLTQDDIDRFNASEPSWWAHCGRIQGEWFKLYKVEIVSDSGVTKYTLTYVADDITIKTEMLAEGATPTPPANPTKEGYTFVGWNNLPETMPAEDVTAVAEFVINYTLSYEADGVVIKTEQLVEGATPTPPANPTKEGYTFVGWNNLPETMPAEDVTAVAEFSVIKYKVIYIVDNVKVDSVEYASGETISEKEKPAKTGYSFDGWYGYPDNMTMPGWNINVTGTFNVNHHNIMYKSDGNDFKGFYYVEYGINLSPDYVPDTNPTKEGYIFTGWTNLPETMPDEDLTIEAAFEVDPDYHVYKTITYYVDYQKVKEVTWEVGQTITPETDSTKVGYTFSGWSGFPDDMVMPNNDISINGYFTINKHNVIYMVDGEEYKRQEYTYGYDIYPEQYPSQTGATFSGWSGFPDDMKMPDHDVTVTGSFGVAQYTIYYYVDNQYYTSTTWSYGDEITSTPEVPDRIGYSFSWEGIPETMPAQDISIRGYYSVNNHNVIYFLDGVEYDRETYQWGATIYPKSNPTLEGYTFSGWSGFPDDMTMPDEDVVILGSFSEIVYRTLTLMLDENTVYRTITLPEGIAIPYINNPVKTGYTFTGWSDDVPSTMPAEDMTLTAQFTQILYTLTFKVDNEDYGTPLQLAAGDAITLPDEPEEREGYTFSGWQNVRDYMPAQDWVIYGSFTKEAEYQTLSVGEAGFNTYCTTKPLYFQGSEDVKAYIAKAKNNNEVTLSQVVGSVAAGTGLVLRGKTANASAQFEVVTSGNTFSNNLLVGVSSETTINSSNKYVLVVKGGYVKFADTGNYSAVVPAGKAYLDAPAAGSRMLSVFFEDNDATFIEGVAADDNGLDAQIYNLGGQRVLNPGKGLYIVNGKKVYIK